MDANLEVLGIYLNEIGVKPADLKFKAGRLITQKSVYLSQCAGADLGYRFKWYMNGPYSSSLAEDYFELLKFTEDTKAFPNGRQLWNQFKDAIQGIKTLFTPLTGSTFESSAWLELIASWHFLLTVSKYTSEEARGILKGKKPHLTEHSDFATNLDDAQNRLVQVGLL